MTLNTVGYAVIALALLFAAGLLTGIIQFKLTVTKPGDNSDDSNDSPDAAYMRKFKAKMELTKKYLAGFAERTRKEGILACESWNSAMLLENKDLDFLAQGMQMAIDGTEPEDLAHWFDNAAMCAGNPLEEIYVEMVKQCVVIIAEHNNLQWVETLLKSFDVDRKVI